MNFEFATATRIIFGAGSVQQVEQLTTQLGERAFVVTGRSKERAGIVLHQLKQKAVGVFQVSGEPSLEMVAAGVAQARALKCDFVVGIGGGSVIDTGKVIAAMLTNEGELPAYLEVIGQGKPLERPSAPYVALPTTAGTGAEVTKNAVLASKEHRVKVSMRSFYMFPRIAVVDPELTYSMPPHITAGTGLDALTQLMEAFVSNKANPLTDGFCREGMQRAARSLKTAYEDGTHVVAREDMSVASLLGGLALANAKLGAVHGFAGPLGGLFSAPHGTICARLLPYVMESNIAALKHRQDGESGLQKYDEIARILTGREHAEAPESVSWIHKLNATLQIPGLARLGLTETDIPIVVAKSKNASSMMGNPVQLTDNEMETILKKAL